MPKFSQNFSTTTGSFGMTGGSNNQSFTTAVFDTYNYSDLVIFAPSVRTTMQTSPMFSETVDGENDNLGSFGVTLEDWRGWYNDYTNTGWKNNYGNTD